MKMKLVAVSLALLSLSAAALPALADGYPAIKLFSGSTTVTGEEIAYPTAGKAHVNAMIVTLAPGEKTMLHQHGVPVFIHILEGEVTVDYGDKGKKTFKQGESFLEAMEVTHAGMNSGTIPVKILAVYMGAEGALDVIPAK
jgi:quercetin dioxygenase-like cupin family protein